MFLKNLTPMRVDQGLQFIFESEKKMTGRRTVREETKGGGGIAETACGERTQ